MKLIREDGYKKIAEFLNLQKDIKVRLFYFPNEDMKFNITGKRGWGNGFDDIIIEVYNDSVKVDPYHELIHILIYTINKPPAMLDEGLAVHLSEKLGDNALLEMIGHPGKKIKLKCMKNSLNTFNV